jgi:meso-butanediol dehydrogenase/(S,S)-butanediol dehydrogenase/diacetyl reductase
MTRRSDVESTARPEIPSENIPMNRLEEKVALVTGAASGIGRATAIRLSAEGAKVFITDVNEAGLAETADAIRKADGYAALRSCDISDSAACEASVGAAVAEFGRLDVLCNVAGIGIYGHASDLSDEQWSRVLGVNLSGTFFMSRAALTPLLETKGNIVNVASTAGLVGIAYAAAYCASKGGVVQLTRSMAVEFAHRGLRVNCVCPGGVDTPLARGFEVPEGGRPELLSRMALVREVGQPEEIAAAIAYLASPEARYVNGAAFAIDGGQVA